MENSKKKSFQRSNKRQIEYLCQYMAQHNTFAAGEYRSPMGAIKCNAEWAKLKSALDELGPTRSVEQWKICWRDQKRKARTEGAALNKAKNATGNVVPVPEMSDNSALVLDAIGYEVAIGCGPEESPIGYNPPSTSYEADVFTEPRAPLSPIGNNQPSTSGHQVCLIEGTPSTQPRAPQSPIGFNQPSTSGHQVCLTQEAPSTAPAPTGPEPRAPLTARSAGARLRRVRRTLPPEQFLNAQLELNNLFKELIPQLIREVRRGNDLREEHLNLLRR